MTSGRERPWHKTNQKTRVIRTARNQMKDNEEAIPEYHRNDRIRQGLERIVNLYESWDKTAKAAKWRAKLPEGAMNERTGESASESGRPEAHNHRIYSRRWS